MKAIYKVLLFFFVLILLYEPALFMQTTSTTDKIYKYLRAHGLTHQGACGMLGNIYSESAAEENTVEILLVQRYDEDNKGGYASFKAINGGYKRPGSVYENRVYNNELYTKRIIDGTIGLEEFLSPRSYTGNTYQYGYGLVGWTTKSRKQGLWDRTMKVGKPINDLAAQIDYLVYELKKIFPSVYNVLTDTSASLKSCSDTVLIKFEAPNDAASMKDTRYSYSKFYSDQYS